MKSQGSHTEFVSPSSPSAEPGVLCTVLFLEFIPWTVPLVCTYLSPRDSPGVTVCRANKWSLGRAGVSTCAHGKLLLCGSLGWGSWLRREVDMNLGLRPALLVQQVLV